MATIRKNENAKKNPYWFQVMVKGKRVTKRGFKTKAEAKASLADIVNDLNKGEFIEPNRIKFGVYFYEWIQSRTSITESTRNLYMSYFKVHINPKLGHYELSTLTPHAIQKFLKESREQELSDETVKRLYSVVNASLNAAKKMEMIKRNVAELVEKPRVKKEERKVWSEETVKKFLNDTQYKSRYWIAFYLAVMTGMRQGEILALKWSDVDLHDKKIVVRRSLRKDTATFSELKTEKSKRTIAITDNVVKELLVQKEKLELEKIYVGENYQDNDLIVPSSLGTVARATKVLKAWNSLQEQFKPHHEPKITFHDLRHQHASLMLQDNTHIKIVSERLGHSNASITLNTYSHLMPNLQEEAARKLEERMTF